MCKISMSLQLENRSGDIAKCSVLEKEVAAALVEGNGGSLNKGVTRMAYSPRLWLMAIGW